GDVDSAAPSFAMWELGREAVASPAVTAAFDRGVDGLVERLRADPEAKSFIEHFDRFIADYGSRGPNEWEARSPTWETKPEMALAAIDRMRLAAPEDSPSARHDERVRDRESLTAEVLEKLAGVPEVQGQMAAALQSARLFLAGRERTKTTIIKIVHEVRMAAMELGRRMVERGVFDKKENMGMLQADELDPFLADPMSFQVVVREREALYQTLQ